MSFNDIEILLAVEKSGEKVISWHSAAIWELLKPKIHSDQTALRASKVLRKNMHYVMCILATIHEAGHERFLTTYLHPEYAAFDYKFTAFDLATGEFKAEQFAVDSLNTQKQAKRYVRISFESLQEYAEKENRKSARWSDKEADAILANVLDLLKKGSDAAAKAEINRLLEHLAKGLSADF